MTFPRIATALLALAATILPGPDDAPPAPTLDMTTAVACKVVNGFEDFEELEVARVTTEDKLLIYYRPRHYTIQETKGGGYLAHFKQDVKVRKRGQKPVLWTKKNLLDFEARSPTPPIRVYLTNNIGVKGFPPGEYDLDIVLHDALKPGASATQTLRFQVVAAPGAGKAVEREPEPETDSKTKPPASGARKEGSRRGR